jgi:hypothetical protein
MLFNAVVGENTIAVWLIKASDRAAVAKEKPL